MRPLAARLSVTLLQALVLIRILLWSGESIRIGLARRHRVHGALWEVLRIDSGLLAFMMTL